MTEFEIKRVVVACDAAANMQVAAAAAASLAARQGAVLRGIFFEDENLRRLTQLEIAAHVGLSGNSTIPAATGPALQAILDICGGTMRRALETAAARHQLSWSFDRARSTDTLSADAGDILMVEAAPRPFSGRWRPRSPWLSMIACNANTVLLRRGHEGRVAVVITPRDAASCEHLVSATFAFAAPDGTVVFMSSASQIRELAQRQAAGGQRLMFEPRSHELATILSRLAQLDPNLLVVSAEEDVTIRDALADATSGDLLVVK